MQHVARTLGIKQKFRNLSSDIGLSENVLLLSRISFWTLLDLWERSEADFGSQQREWQVRCSLALLRCWLFKGGLLVHIRRVVKKLNSEFRKSQPRCDNSHIPNVANVHSKTIHKKSVYILSMDQNRGNPQILWRCLLDLEMLIIFILRLSHINHRR